MPAKQRVLILWTSHPEPGSGVCAWSSYDPERPSTAGDAEAPPYPSVLAAMGDGWRVVQFPRPLPVIPGAEHQLGFLKHEYILERITEATHAV
jgi:hypothetical protein